MKILIYSFFLFLIFNSQIAYSQNYKKQKRNFALVEVSEVKKKNVQLSTDTVGRIVSLKPYIIVSKVSEQVLKKYVLEGDNLKKGQKILELETKNIIRLIERFKEEIKYNKVTQKLILKELEIVNKKIDRFIKLNEKKIISDDVLDGLKISRINLKKQLAKIDFDLKKLKFQLLASKEDLLETKVVSPVDGNIINLNIEIGSILQKGQKLASIIVQNKNEIEADIRSELASKINIGSNVRIKISKNKVVLGKIRSIVGYEKIKTGSRIIRIYLPQTFPNSLNFPGKRLELSVPIGNPNLVLTINKDSLIAESEKKFVYIFKNGIALKKYILTGISHENDIEVISGIKKGDLVIVKGNENLRPNQPVKINNQKKSFKRKNKKNN